MAARGFTGTNDNNPTIWAPVASYHLAVGGPAVDRNTALMVDVVARLGSGCLPSAGPGGIERGCDVDTNTRLDSSGQPLTGVTLPLLTDPVDRADAAQNALVVAIVMSVIGLGTSARLRQRDQPAPCQRDDPPTGVCRPARARGQPLAHRPSADDGEPRAWHRGRCIGLLFTTWLVPLLARVAEAPATLDFSPDIRVYGFLGAISLVAGLGAGLVPARHAMRDNFASPLKGSSPGAGGTSRSRASRSALVGIQAAASLVLLVVAALLTRGMVRATQVDVGFDAHRLLTIDPEFARGAYDAAGTKACWTRALERVRALPGVQLALARRAPPFSGASR